MGATRPTGVDPIRAGTGRAWTEWLAWLEAIGARDLPHKEIARRVKAEGGTSGWWAQYVTVAYEQHIGRRVPGQDHLGHFQVSATRTLPGSMDEAIEAWSELAGRQDGFNGVAMADRPRRSATDNWRHWRVQLDDGSRLVASAHEKAPGKAVLAIMHEKLADGAALATWRTFWKAMLARL